MALRDRGAALAREGAACALSGGVAWSKEHASEERFLAGYGEATPFLEIAYNTEELFRVSRAFDQQAEVVRKGQVVEVPDSDDAVANARCLEETQESINEQVEQQWRQGTALCRSAIHLNLGGALTLHRDGHACLFIHGFD